VKWLRGRLTTPLIDGDAVRGALLVEGFKGWEEVDIDGKVEFTFYCAADSEAAPVEALPASAVALAERVATRVAWDAVDDEDWAHAWKRFWKPQRIGKRLVVKPSWETWNAAAEDVVIELDPGMAFGTGTHETTRMCLEWLEQIVRPGDRVLDVGTGSGILAIASLLLGAGEVEAFDNDPIAVRTAGQNLERNGLSGRARVFEAAAVAEGKTFNIVTANLVADLIILLAPSMAGALEPGGALIASGIIRERADEVSDALVAASFVSQDRRTQGEWVSIAARKG
jgi:ribosomal protein L11 methyltransferase